MKLKSRIEFLATLIYVTWSLILIEKRIENKI